MAFKDKFTTTKWSARGIYFSWVDRKYKVREELFQTRRDAMKQKTAWDMEILSTTSLSTGPRFDTPSMVTVAKVRVTEDK